MSATWIKTLAASSIVHVGFAFVVMGGWAVFANRAHGLPRAMVAGLVQGLLSAGLTLLLKTVIDRLAVSFSGPSRLWAPPLIACLGSTAVLLIFHHLAGTPEIVPTIAVPLLVSTSYAAVYNYSIFARTRG